MHKTKLLCEYWDDAKKIIQARKDKGEPEYPTGLQSLDSLTGGFHPGEIWIIAGKTGSGKTSMALNLARSFADNPSHSILFLSLEMKGWQLALRMYSDMMRENCSDLEQGRIDIDPQKNLTFEQFIRAMDYEIVEYGYTWPEVLKIFDDLYKHKKPDIIFLDFMQLIEIPNQKDERMAIQEYIRKIKEYANRYSLGFVIVSQIRRLPSGADYNRPPDIIDLMGSGSLEQTADKILLIYKTIEEGGVVKHFVNLAKNRQGRTATSEIRFVGEQYRFEDIPMVIYGDNDNEANYAKRQ